MSGFSAAWLRLREPYDVRSRSDELVRRLRSQLLAHPLKAMDLGTGTAANVRYLAPRLGGEQLWQTVDNDVALIAEQPAELRGPDFSCALTPMQIDLATQLHRLPFAGCHLVTASALLDLASASWLDELARHCAGAGACVLFALSYDGRMECSPCDPDDAWLNTVIDRHQQGDKGFGPALGPNATSHACKAFAAFDYSVHTVASDWVIEPEGRELQSELLDGWIAAACEIAAEDKFRIMEWGKRRKAHLFAGRSRLRVGHQDCIAWPRRAGGSR